MLKGNIAGVKKECYEVIATVKKTMASINKETKKIQTAYNELNSAFCKITPMIANG